MDLTDKQIDFALKYIVHYLREGATIKAMDPSRVMEYLDENKIYGGLHITFPTDSKGKGKGEGKGFVYNI